MASEAWRKEKEFLDYMFVSLHHGGLVDAEEHLPDADVPEGEARRSVGTPTAPKSSMLPKTPIDGIPPTPLGPQSVSASGSTRLGFDHLDNLCKLMEQLGELRDQNSRVG